MLCVHVKICYRKTHFVSLICVQNTKRHTNFVYIYTMRKYTLYYEHRCIVVCTRVSLTHICVYPHVYILTHERAHRKHATAVCVRQILWFEHTLCIIDICASLCVHLYNWHTCMCIYTFIYIHTNTRAVAVFSTYVYSCAYLSPVDTCLFTATPTLRYIHTTHTLVLHTFMHAIHPHLRYNTYIRMQEYQCMFDTS